MQLKVWPCVGTLTWYPPRYIHVSVVFTLPTLLQPLCTHQVPGCIVAVAIVKAGSHLFACVALWPEVHMKWFGCTSRRSNRKKFYSSVVYTRPNHFVTLPVATRRKQKRCEPAFTLLACSCKLYIVVSQDVHVVIVAQLFYLNEMHVLVETSIYIACYSHRGISTLCFYLQLHPVMDWTAVLRLLVVCREDKGS